MMPQPVQCTNGDTSGRWNHTRNGDDTSSSQSVNVGASSLTFKSRQFVILEMIWQHNQ